MPQFMRQDRSQFFVVESIHVVLSDGYLAQRAAAKGEWVAMAKDADWLPNRSSSLPKGVRWPSRSTALQFGHGAKAVESKFYALRIPRRYGDAIRPYG